MSDLHILIQDMAGLARAAASAAQAADWVSVERYEQARQQLVSRIAALGADSVQRPEVIEALKRAETHSVQIEAAIAKGRAVQDRASAEASHSARASRAYVSVRTA